MANPHSKIIAASVMTIIRGRGNFGSPVRYLAAPGMRRPCAYSGRNCLRFGLILVFNSLALWRMWGSRLSAGRTAQKAYNRTTSRLLAHCGASVFTPVSFWRAEEKDERFPGPSNARPENTSGTILPSSTTTVPPTTK